MFTKNNTDIFIQVEHLKSYYLKESKSKYYIYDTVEMGDILVSFH